MVINLTDAAADSTAEPEAGNSPMQIFSFILAFAFILAGPSIAGSSETNLPGIGTFAYSGSAVMADSSRLALVASR